MDMLRVSTFLFQAQRILEEISHRSCSIFCLGVLSPTFRQISVFSCELFWGLVFLGTWLRSLVRNGDKWGFLPFCLRRFLGRYPSLFLCLEMLEQCSFYHHQQWYDRVTFSDLVTALIFLFLVVSLSTFGIRLCWPQNKSGVLPPLQLFWRIWGGLILLL